MVGPYDDMDLRMRNQKQREYYCTVCGVTSLDPIGEDDKRIPKELAAAQAIIVGLENARKMDCEAAYKAGLEVGELLRSKDATIKELEKDLAARRFDIDQLAAIAKEQDDRLAKCEKVVDLYADHKNWDGDRWNQYHAIDGGTEARAYRKEFPREV